MFQRQACHVRCHSRCSPCRKPGGFSGHVVWRSQAVVQNVVRSTLSLTFVIAAARVVFNVKGRLTRETIWELELKGDLTKQRRVEAVDKLLSVLTLLVASVFGLQAVGLDGAHPMGCAPHGAGYGLGTPWAGL